MLMGKPINMNQEGRPSNNCREYRGNSVMLVRVQPSPLRSGSSNRTVLQVVATLLAFGRAFRKEEVEGESPSRCTMLG